ncbi:MAG TPA: hypothetical protein VHP32_03265 [Ignavibacteria bacterium]|nr:hypothetical protein [Ignavibacteria bacterium]
MKTYEAESELSVIKKIMEDSRKLNVDNGFYYIFWGILTSTALILNYLLIIYNYSGQYIGFMWMILMVIGAIIGTIAGAKMEKKKKVKTFAGEILSSLWIAIGAIIFTFVFIGIFTKVYNAIYISGFVSCLLAIGYFTSGTIQRLNWLKYLSLAWFLGGWAFFMKPTTESLLYFALMLIFFQTIPGIILYKKYKRDLNSELPSIV